jgi:hypothetical protein
MNLINATKMQAGYTMGIQPDGRELLVVVVKGTFAFPQDEKLEPKLADEQAPLVMTDVFTGEPGFSAPLYENDFAPRKPKCDVLLNGSAYAPGGKPSERVPVSLRVGSWSKSFDVVGNRVWQAGALYIAVSKPEPFTVMPISYNNAWGGVDKSQEDPLKYRYYPLNHAGVGFHEYTSAKYMDGKPLPNTEERSNKTSNPKGSYKPMAFGPVGRAWQPRPKLAGTYDKNWLDNKFPFLPDDFKDEYYQAASADQWTDYVKGGEGVELINLTPTSRTSFKLPKKTIPFEFFYKDGGMKKMPGIIDTLLIEPDLTRFTMTWRCTTPLRKNIHEIKCVVAGTKGHSWYREQRLRPVHSPSKRRFLSLAQMVRKKKPKAPPGS